MINVHLEPQKSMDKFSFRYFKVKHSDGRIGVCMFGNSPDHHYPMRVINEFLGENVLELHGSGIYVHLFLPETKLEQWQKLALFDIAWAPEEDKSQKATIYLDKLK